jgi:hypothetical protein
MPSVQRPSPSTQAPGFSIIEMENTPFQNFGSDYLVGPLRSQLSDEELVRFVNDEICLA